MVSSSHHEKGFCASKFHKVYFLSILPLFYFCLFCGSSIIFAVLYKHRKDTLFLLQMTYDFCHRALSNWKSALKVEKKILLGVFWINPIFHHSHSSILVFGHSFSPYGPPSRQITHIYLKTVYSSCQKLYNLKIYTKYIYIFCFLIQKRHFLRRKQRCLYFIILSIDVYTYICIFNIYTIWSIYKIWPHNCSIIQAMPEGSN